jgi:hypothetical protein
LDKFREFLNEALPQIILDGVILNWNPNKTEIQFKEIIKKRTSLSEKEFYETIQRGFDTIKSVPHNKDICVFFLKSNFVIIINMIQKRIVTIRHGDWNNTKCDGGFKYTNEEMITFCQDYLDLLNRGDVIETIGVNEDWSVNVKIKCSQCYSIKF